MRIEQCLVFLRQLTIVAIIRQVAEAIMVLVVVEGGIMEDGIITVVEEDRIIAMAKTIREEEISSTAEVVMVGEVMPKVLMEEDTIKEEEEEAPIAIRTEEEAARTTTIKEEVEVDQVIIREGATQTKNDIEDETQTNILKIQE